jgi:type III secretion protein T
MLEPALIEAAAYGTLSVLLSMTRILGIFLVFPLFSWTGVQGSLRATIAIALSLPVAYAVFPTLGPVQDNVLNYIVLAMKELVVGIGIGLLLAIPFWAAKSAGDVIDIYRGASQSNIFDPLNAAESTETGTLLLLGSLALFVAAGGLNLVMGIAYDSYRIWRPTVLVPDLSMDAFKVLLRILTEISRKAVILAAPILIALAIGEIILLFVSLGWKNYNVMDLSMIMKNLLLVILLPVYLIFLMSYLGTNWSSAHLLLNELIPGIR